jgi:glycosyltransferase involved in cell wall biosynthesis
MRVGFNAALLHRCKITERLSCLEHIAATFHDVLSERHDVVLVPPDYYEVPAARRAAMAEELVRSCDVILSQPDFRLLSARAELDSPVPFCILLLGSLPRGFRDLPWLGEMLRPSDILVANCGADLKIASELLENATVRRLPFAYREQVFHPPTAEEVAAVRPWVGVPDGVPLVLYAGRHTLEKNVHTVVKVFGMVQAAVPDAHLVLAGPVENVEFAEYGVFPVTVSTMLDRMIDRMGLSERVHLAGAISPENLRALYGAADVVVNLSLHHDENFGLVQVEAMACGSPVVGTRWGGLQDTVAHGEAGYQVSTVPTAHGVKSNWWEAANRIARLLRDSGLRASFGARAVEIARERFSPAAVARQLEAILHDAVAATPTREPLRGTAFAEEYWETLEWSPDALPPARKSPEALALHRRLITPYTGTAPGGVDPGQPLSPEQGVILAHPVAWNEDGTLAILDPQFPFDVPVPAQLAGAVRHALDALASQPVTSVGALVRGPEPADRAREAIAWMLEAGLVLRASADLQEIDPALVREQATRPFITIRRVEHPVDVIYTA